MEEPRHALPTPGLIGILIRLLLGVLVLSMAYDALFNAPSYWDGYSNPWGSLGNIIPLALFSSWVINELLRTRWKWWPTVVMLGLLGIALVIGAAQGDVFGPAFGSVVWVWTVAFSMLLGPALVLAGVLRTPGCEMRSFAHLWTKIRGGDPDTVVCPGWIDRFDGVRLFGRF